MPTARRRAHSVDPAEDLAAAADAAAAIGVNLETELDGDTVWIRDVERRSGRPGSGARVLGNLMEIAEDHGLRIAAAVVRDHDVLLPYYEEMGFDVHSADDDRTVVMFTP